MALENFDFELNIPSENIPLAQFVLDFNIYAHLLVVSQQLNELISLQSEKPLEEVQRIYSDVFRDYTKDVPAKFAAKFGRVQGKTTVS